MRTNLIRIPLLAGLCALAACEDTVTVANADGDVGLLVDGADGGGIVNDRGAVASGSGEVRFDLDPLDAAAAPARNEAIAFGTNRATVRADTPWTDSADDAFTVTLGAPLALPLTVWIVQGPFADQRSHAIDAIAETALIWEEERTGFAFSTVDIRDATQDPDIDPDILDSTGGDGRNWDDFSDGIGFDAGRVNVYWINTVEGSTTTGWSDFGGRIVMGRNTGDELLVHEIGHAFSLRHPQGCGGSTADFDRTNVMWPCSGSRAFFTEGQTFRAHFNAASSVNALYGARPGQPTAACIGGTANAECPARDRRLWDDGAYPAN